MELGENYSAISLSADRSLLGAHSGGDVDFTDRRPDHATTGLSRYVIDDATGRKVRHYDTHAMPQHHLRGESQRVVLANGHTLLRDERQSIDVGIDRHSDVAV